MDNKAFAEILERRTKSFAVDIIRLSIRLPNTKEASVVGNQLTKSGTSIGANYREANHARSRADFRSKIRICESEAGETLYWLEIINDLKWLSTERTEPLIKECNELIALFSSIAKAL